MKYTTLSICFSFFGLLVATNSCTADKTTESLRDEALCNSVNITYDAHIKHIIDTKCTTCHDGGTQFSLQGFNAVNNWKNDIHQKVLSYQMPKSPGDPLTEAQIDSIHCWKLNGFPQN